MLKMMLSADWKTMSYMCRSSSSMLTTMMKMKNLVVVEIEYLTKRYSLKKLLMQHNCNVGKAFVGIVDYAFDTARIQTDKNIDPSSMDIDFDNIDSVVQIVEPEYNCTFVVVAVVVVGIDIYTFRCIDYSEYQVV